MQSVPAHYYLPGPEVSVLETQTRSKLRYLQNKAITVRPMGGGEAYRNSANRVQM